MTILPLSRRTEIVVQEFGAEKLIYDLNINKALVLNETCAEVYQACDGQTTFEELKRRHNFTDEIIFLALDQLQRENLLMEMSDQASLFKGLSRREVIKRAGLTSMVALPIISTVVAPSALMAQSGTNLPLNAACSANGQCASGNCLGNTKCCSATSTGGTAPNVFLGFINGPAGACSAFPQANQNAFCSSNFTPVQCCSGVVISNPCTDLGGFPRLSCRCQ